MKIVLNITKEERELLNTAIVTNDDILEILEGIMEDSLSDVKRQIREYTAWK